ncbi:hypothetical protein PF010_g15758 [Phytophthora fragariae]|uniref:MULE transposase domain-containing protein n=1 Tax=Phytophthora fragariae TaxID=53985 RepID=A0A6G0KT93_9STRA|nr:hypothetical protein PF010_g15758 [Phytophthora fragariae]
MAREDSQLLMEDIKFFIIVKSQLVPCVVCALTRPHKMRYQLLRCSSETCKAATPYDACPWMGKVMTCQELNRVTIMEAGAHETLMRDPRKPKMTPRLKDYGREMATQGLKPARIRMGMARRFGLSETDLPTLNQVQWFIAAFTKAKLHRNDDYDDILGQIDALAYGPETNETQPFLFAWQRTAQGKPDVGNGSDEHPFLVGLTSKRLLRNAARDPASFVFHMDATFKLNQLSYPVIVCGVSDRNRSFHLVALFTTSQRLEELYVKALSALRKVFTAVTGKQLLVKYVMADAEAAQQNAVDQVFGVDSDFLYLMCFYHVMAKVYERIKGVSQRLREQVTADIYDLHFAPTQATYDEQWTTVFANWSGKNELTDFRGYFRRVWVRSEFHRWQCFHTPSGYATTNDPVEQFNRLIKRDYTLRTKHKIGTLFQLLADCCEHQSVTPRKFKDVPEVTQQLKARVNDFRQRNLLVDITPSRSSIEFLLVSPNPNLLKNYTGLDGKRTLVNRSVSKKRRRTPAVNARAAAGRPPTNGHALSTE